MFGQYVNPAFHEMIFSVIKLFLLKKFIYDLNHNPLQGYLGFKIDICHCLPDYSIALLYHSIGY